MDYIFVFLLTVFYSSLCVWYIGFLLGVYIGEPASHWKEEPEEQVYPVQAVLYDHNGHPVFVNDVEKIKEKHNDNPQK